jgi:hypothetical protein
MVLRKFWRIIIIIIIIIIKKCKQVQNLIKHLNRSTILKFPYLKGKETQTGYKDTRHPKKNCTASSSGSETWG